MKIYIIPTRFGLMSAALLGVMLFVGLTYGNNGVLLIAFLLASLLMAIMLETHRQLKSLKVDSVEAFDGFVGSFAEIRLTVRNRSRQHIHGIQVAPNSQMNNSYSVAPGDTSVIVATVEVPKRGVNRIRRIRIGTQSPVGLFWTWSYWPESLQFLGYPRPVGRFEYPEPEGTEADGNHRARLQGDDFAGHRAFEPGESWRRVDWKLVARGQPWMVKSFEGGRPRQWAFQFERLPGDTESRLSQLALWIQRAHQEEKRFSLKIANQEIPPGVGAGHATRCLKELAVYGEDDRAAA